MYKSIYGERTQTTYCTPTLKNKAKMKNIYHTVQQSMQAHAGNNNSAKSIECRQNFYLQWKYLAKTQ